MKKVLMTGANSYIGTSFEKYITNKYSNDYIVDTQDMIGEQWKNKDFSTYDVVFHVAGIAHSDNGKISKEKEELYGGIHPPHGKTVRASSGAVLRAFRSLWRL